MRRYDLEATTDERDDGEEEAAVDLEEAVDESRSSSFIIEKDGTALGLTPSPPSCERSPSSVMGVKWRMP